jgi:dienelactone hydrolase
MLKQTIDYQDNDVTLEGYYAYDDTITTPRPAVLVCHDWSGKNAFACHKADQLAELGYVGFALDMYGKNKVGNTKEEKSALMSPLIENRDMLQQRILSALDAVKKIPLVDQHKIAAIGFCFGGLCVLDLARTGADVKGIVSFHGLLSAPDNIPAPQIKASILALHGYDDPMVTPSDVFTFGEEMTAAKADWEVNMYGNTMHAFTNPLANDPDFGTVYSKSADEKSWLAMRAFLQMIF